MIWWAIGVFWAGILCGICAMSMFIAGNKSYPHRVTEETERLRGHPPQMGPQRKPKGAVIPLRYP
jgi:hypothetical protein